MTDTDSLDDLARKISSSHTPNIRRYALAQAAATQSQEAEIRRLAEEVELLRGSSDFPRDSAPVTDPYWSEDWSSGALPANWTTEKSVFGAGSTNNLSYSFPTDPTSTYGSVLLLSCNQDTGKTTDYASNSKQLVSLYRTAQNAHSGYQQVAEETWYRVRFMVPTGSVQSNGDTNNIVEWHTDSNTQSLGGNSPALWLWGGFPLTSGGTTAPQIILRWASGSPSSPTYTYWPSSDGSGSYAQKNPIAVTHDHWYEAKFHVIWSKDSGVGLVEWWLDSVSKLSRQMATCYTNANLTNGQSYHTFGLYNYRYNVTGDSDVYFDLCMGGPDEASVSG